MAGAGSKAVIRLNVYLLLRDGKARSKIFNKIKT